MARFSILKWMMDQLCHIPPVSDFFSGDLVEKTVIVTGANTGVGLAVARHLAALNPKMLIIGCRNAKKAEIALQCIRDTTGYQAVQAWNLDLASFASVRAFVERYEREGPDHLDLLIENAGAFTTQYKQTIDGWERSLQVNYLGPALLAFLLLPFLLKAPSTAPFPRLIIVASESHLFVQSLLEAKYANILETMNEESKMRLRYPVTKMMNIFFTRALAMRLQPPPAGLLTVTCVSPGFCCSELGREITSCHELMLKIIAEFSFGRATEVGGRVVLWAALGGQPDEIHGRYTGTCRVEEESDLILSEEGSEFGERLWNETIQVLSKEDIRVKDINNEYLCSI